MHPEEFLEQQKKRSEKKKRHAIIACVVICMAWIPIALFLYKPVSLFGDAEGDQPNTTSES